MHTAREQAKNDRLIGGKRYDIHAGLVRTLALHDEITDSPADPESNVREIRLEDPSADLFTFLKTPLDTAPKQPFFFEWDNLAVLKISSYENWFRNQVHPNTRTNIRKAAKKGIVVRVEQFSDRLAEGLVGLFNETPIRQGRRYGYYGWDLQEVKREWATQLDQSLWVVAYYGEQLVGFVKLILSNGVARTSGTIARQAHLDKAPMNALLSECVKLCEAKRIPLLVYGKMVYGRKGETSLSEFKRHNGFEKIELPRYYIPLSTLGRIGLQLGLHKSLIDIIPGPALRTVLRLRSKWYQVRKWRTA